MKGIVFYFKHRKARIKHVPDGNDTRRDSAGKTAFSLGIGTGENTDASLYP
jgi:hypothetical protein